MRKRDYYKVSYEGQDKLSPAAKKAKKSTDELNSASKNLTGSFGKLGAAAKTALPFIGGAAVVGGFTKMIKMTAEAGDKFAKMSQKVGISVETLSTFDHVAKLSGITIDTVAVGLRRFAQNALDMSRGIGEAKREFEALGIPVTDASGKVREMEDLLLDVAELFSRMEDGTVKTAMAMRLFGRSGTEMIPMLNKGREGIRNMMKEAEKLGLVFSAEKAKEMERFNDNMLRMKNQMKGLAFQIMPPLIENMSEFLEMLGFAQFKTAKENMRGYIETARNEIAELQRELEEGAAMAGPMGIEIPGISAERTKEIKERIADLNAEIRMYSQHLDYTTEIEKRNAGAKLELKEATDELAKAVEWESSIRLKAAIREAEATDAFIGLAGTKEAKYELLKELEQERAETEQWEHEKRLARYIREQEALDEWLGNLDAFHARHGEIQESMAAQSSQFADIAAEGLDRVGDAMASTTAAMIFGQNAWKAALQGLLSSLLSFLAKKGIKKFKEMIASSAEQTAKAAEAVAEFNYAGAISHGLAAAGFSTAASKWAGVFHKGGMIPEKEVLIRALPGEAILSHRGVEAVGGPAGVDLANRGISIGTIVQTNNMGGIHNMANAEDIAILIGEQILTTIRESA